MPVMVMDWKSWNMASWNRGGICLMRIPGMLYGHGALWLGSIRRASLKTARVSLPMIMCWAGEGVAGIASNHGKGAFASILGSGESSFVSTFLTIAMTSAGMLVMILVSGSRSAERC